MEQHIEILEKAGLNWTVSGEGVRTESGIIIPKTKCIIRDDNKTPLGIHKEGYDPYQNHELLELLYRIGQSTGLTYHSAGLLGKGEKVWFQMKSNSHIMPGNDRIDGFITGINSFDGRTALAFGNSTHTISCSNTFWMVYHEVSTKLRHSSKMRPRIEDILNGVDNLIEEEKKTFQTIDQLAQVRITKDVKDLVTKMLFDIAREDRLEELELSTNKVNKLSRFNLDYDIEIAQKGDNLWGLFSSVTRYTTHSMRKDGKDNTASKIVGSAGTKERKIWKSLVQELY